MTSPPLPLARGVLFAVLVLSFCAAAQNRTRTELNFPDVPGFVTLKCDFHMHTVFSDGLVWPTLRAEEAWRNGLDVIAVTDHIEYLPHKADIATNYGRPYEIARGTADPLGLMTIRAAEITRGEPPGHWNALFLTNVAALQPTNYWVALSNACEQGAFVFWNHPAWKQADGKPVWYAEQEQALTNGLLRGIEIVNGTDYDPVAHQWCLDKRLTMFGNSDAHSPISFEYSMTPGDMRPVTLVFARERTYEAIREALFERRTAVWSKDRLIGEAQFLGPLFQGSIQVINPEIRIRGKGSALLQIRNNAPLRFDLRLNPKLPELDVTDKATLAPGKVSLLTVRCLSDRVTGEQVLFLPCRVTNLLVAPERSLRTALKLKVSFEPASK